MLLGPYFCVAVCIEGKYLMSILARICRRPCHNFFLLYVGLGFYLDEKTHL